MPGNITFKNCEFETIDRFINYDYSGNNRWQCNRPLESISFENVSAKNIRIPLFLYGDKKEPIKTTLKDVNISFAKQVDAFIYACNCKEIFLSNVTIKGVKDSLIKSWGNIGKIQCDNVTGVEISTVETNAQWNFQVI